MIKTKGKILVVDDNLMNLELIKDTLEPFDYEISAYTNPVEALEKEKTSQVDLVLVDVVMPELDGFNFAKKFTPTHPNTPIAYISAYNQSENKIKGYNLGSCIYIEKPFDVNTLRAQIQSILRLKAVQDELLYEKQKLDYIFEFSSNEMILTDLNFNIISQNHKILTQNEIQNDNFLDIITKFADKENLDEIKDFTKSNTNHLQARFVFLNKKHIKATFSKINPNNKTIGYLIILEDLTEEVEKEQLQHSFIDILSHHLKTPVRAERRALQLLIENSFGTLNDDQKDIVGEILNSTKCMLHMMDNILTRYKLDSGEFKIHKTTNSINKSIQYCLNNLNYLFQSRKQTVKINSLIKNDEHYVFEYDDTEIKRVLTNLIHNASEYSPISSEINITIKRDEKNVQITVKDEGMGLPDEILKSTLDETYCGQKYKKVGAGQGLYIIKKIIEAHNGRIKIETSSSNPNKTMGKGTTFTFYLPCIKTLNKTYVQS